MAIFLMKVQTGMTNRDIGNLSRSYELFSGSEGIGAISTRLSEDKTLRKKVDQVNAILSEFKG